MAYQCVPTLILYNFMYFWLESVLYWSSELKKITIKYQPLDGLPNYTSLCAKLVSYWPKFHLFETFNFVAMKLIFDIKSLSFIASCIILSTRNNLWIFYSSEYFFCRFITFSVRKVQFRWGSWFNYRWSSCACHSDALFYHWFKSHPFQNGNPWYIWN